MTVVDHSPSSWYLVRDAARLLLDVNCSHSAVSTPFLMELNDEELRAYASKGRAFIIEVAEQVQLSAPGVAGTDSPYRDRNLTSAARAEADAVILAWLKLSESR
jgi:hypothetical protein